MNYYQQPAGYIPQAPVGFVGQPMYPQAQPMYPQVPMYPQGQPMMGQPMMGQPDMMSPYPFPQDGGRIPQEQSYIENILRLNLGKVATVYMNFEASQWGSKIFKGYVMAAGRDHIILKDLQSETRYVLLMVYLNYITFDEEIEYDYPYRKAEKSS